MKVNYSLLSTKHSIDSGTCSSLFVFGNQKIFLKRTDSRVQASINETNIEKENTHKIVNTIRSQRMVTLNISKNKNKCQFECIAAFSLWSLISK